MRFCAATAVLTLLAGSLAWGQTDNAVVVPPAPPIVSAPLASPAPVAPPAAQPPPGLVQTQPPPVPAAAATDSSTADAAPATPNNWVVGTTALLGVLDKVDGSTTKISIPAGGQANVGDLQISVQSCVNRPAGQLPDAAIFLTVQPLSNTAGPPLFRGWMVRSTPGATVVGDAGEIFRVMGCS
ncbi:hypothetical protein GCM10010909_15030 [Acidocella aquatica]|uniref:DUF2155 domain-containing protein n=1 Tax=Acidocella aquatica TaxID=1922313 RepID=A0ABQ6A692_9PROT|nr:DUF2155 domain-containing protein [Acidocella aquatica]GLR66823.1 hypothetical protein GCM10010909_15030 [Acidocella aquatica]